MLKYLYEDKKATFRSNNYGQKNRLSSFCLLWHGLWISFGFFKLRITDKQQLALHAQALSLILKFLWRNTDSFAFQKPELL